MMKTNQMDKEEYFETVDTVAKSQIAYVTIQIWVFEYLYNKKRRENLNTPKPYGTGILINYMGKKFIFTAQHICENRSDDNPLYIRTAEDKFITIVGKVGMIDSTDGSGIDLAFIDLNEELIKIINRIPNKKFLGAEHIGHVGTLEENESLVAIGFPELKTKVNKEDLSISTIGAIWLLKEARDDMYKYYKKEKAIFYGLNYHGVQTGIINNVKSTKIDPEGISGGGIWKIWIQTFEGKELIRFHLVGILSEYVKGKYHILWANRIELLMDLINKTYGFPSIVQRIQ